MNAISHREVPAPAIRPQNFAELDRFAQMAAKSSFVPKDYQNRPDNILVAVQMGSEVGLAPMQSLQNIAVINGRPSIWGDAMLALCRRSPLCEDVSESIEGEGETTTAVCVARRRGAKPVVSRFGVPDAKRANLWGKAGPWTQYPQRMLQMRARGFALRDAFPDLLRGLVSAEEAADTPSGPTIDGAAEPQPPPEPRKSKPAPPAPPAQPPEAAADAGGNGDAPPPAASVSWLEAHTHRLESEQDVGRWIILYEDACATASNERELVRLHGITVVSNALQRAPKAVRDRMTLASSAAFKRLAVPPQDALPGIPPETWDQETGEITPADRLMSG